MRRLTASVVLLIAVGLAVCYAQEAFRNLQAKPKDDTKALVEGNNAFALDLYAKLREQEGNLFFSPFSISTALGMTYAGARGETEAQMAKVLRFPSDEVHIAVQVEQQGFQAQKILHIPWPQEKLHPAFKALIEDLNARQKKGAYELSVANALWGQKGYAWLDEFLKITRDNYGAGLREVDFVTDTEGARKTINDWVEKETKEKIKELVPAGVLDELTRLVLTNAIYFKGKWASQFEKEATQDAMFMPGGPGGEHLMVPTMHQTEDFGYMETEGFQALELPYVENELSMIVFLPKKMDGLAELEKSFTADNLAKWLPELHKQEVQVELPRFKMTSEFRLDQVLKSMGMTDAFSLPPADFSGMDGKKDLFISAVLHKAFVDVNEEGTEAAAATAVVAVGGRVLERFRADHPFLFLIRDNRTGSILFMGRVTNPQEQG